MAIKLLKNLKEDSQEELAISSYDIASLIYHYPTSNIRCETARDLVYSRA